MPKRKSLPSFSSYEAAADWLDTHSTADIGSKPAKFTLSPNFPLVIVDSRDHPVEAISLKKQMSRQIRKIANHHGITPQRLVEHWLRDKIKENSRLASRRQTPTPIQHQASSILHPVSHIPYPASRFTQSNQ